jgi:hypothetical protein
MKKLITGLFLTLALGANAHAQSLDAQIDLARQAHNTDREALITMNQHFTVAEGEAFWPLYREYRALMNANGDMRLALIKEFAASYDTLTDEQANKLLLKSYDIQEDRTDTRRMYALKFQEVLPGKKVARIMQLESKMDTAIDMRLAAEIPFVK